MKEIWADVMVAANHSDADVWKSRMPDLQDHLVVTPRTSLAGEFFIRTWVWTPAAEKLPPRKRLALRGKMAPYMTEVSIQARISD